VANLIWLGLLIAGVLFVAWLRTRDLFEITKFIIGPMDRLTRRIGLLSSFPGAAAAVWLIIRGVQPPACVVVGMLCTLGVFAVLVSILHMEGVLLETSSNSAFRRAQGLPPPSTPRGRVVAATLGAMAIGVTAYAIWYVIGKG
jgi:hypothetical protein